VGEEEIKEERRGEKERGKERGENGEEREKRGERREEREERREENLDNSQGTLPDNNFLPSLLNVWLSFKKSTTVIQTTFRYLV
jgi:hypothetical protein